MKPAIVVLTLCAIPRLLALWWYPSPELTFYWYLSSTLLESGTFGAPGAPDTHVEPLYPLFLAAARWMTGDALTLVLVVQILIASLGGLLLFRLTVSLLGSERAAWMAAVLYAFDPYLVRQSVGNMEVAVLTTILIAVAWAARRPGASSAVLTGAFLGAAILTRFALLPLLVLVPVVLGRRASRQALACAGIAVLLIVPWSVRGVRLDGAAIPSRAGLNLAVSLTDAAEQLLPAHNNDRLVPVLADKPDDELLADAWRTIRERPWRAVKMKARNFLHVFNPRLLPYMEEGRSAQLREEKGRYWIEGGTPRPPLAEWAHALWRGTLLAFAVLGVWRRGFRWDDGVLWAVVLTITAVCTVFYPTTRLTTPMVWAWMVWASPLRGSTATRQIPR